MVVPHSHILGVFDLDNSSWSHRTRSFLEQAEDEGRVVSVCDDIPRSFLVCADQKGGAVTVYISQLSAATLLKRTENNSFE